MTGYTPNFSIPYPEEGDPIRGNVADYIRTDLEDMARATDASLVEVRLAGHWRGGSPLPGSADLTALEPGVYTVWSKTAAGALGLPTSEQGVLEAFWYGNTGGIQRWTTRQHGAQPQVWVRQYGSNSWDDWIRIDADSKYDWWRGRSLLPGDADIDSLDFPSGVFTVWGGSYADKLGLPTSTQGVLETFRYGNEGAIQRWTTRQHGVKPQVWLRQYGSPSWDAWVRVDAGAAIEQGSTSAASGFKTLPLAITLGNNGSADAPSSLTVRYALHFNAPITRWRFHVANRNARSGATRAGNIAFTAWQIGAEGSNGAIQSPTTVAPAFSTDGTGWVSQWLTTPIGTDTPLLLGTSYTATAAPYMQVGACWRGSSASSLTRQTTAPFEVWIEAETPSLTPAPAVLGSSSDAGVGGSRPVVDSTLSRWARAHGALPVHYANSGSAMNGVRDSSAYLWTRWAHLDRPDSLLFALGSNDVYGPLSLAEIQALHAEISQIAADRISPVQYGATVFRRATGEAEHRQAYNAWLMTQPNGLRQVFDFAAAIGSPPNPAYDADGVHLNDAGQDALLASIGAPLTAPAPLYA